MTVLPLLLAALMSTEVPTEICRFRAGDPENPFQRWLSSPEVTCSASPALPAGLWNVFAKSEGAVSTTATVEAETAPELSLMPAATLVVQLPPKARAVIYAPRLGSAWPGPEVPAKEPLWLFVIGHGVFPIGAIEAGATATFDARGAAPPAVIGWIEVPEADRAALRVARGLSTPGVAARADRTTRSADPLPPLDSLHGAFVRFANVPAGDGELVLAGRGWITDRVRIRVEPATTLVAQPLAARAAGSLLVTWTLEDDLVALERSLGACKRDSEAKGEITISACSGRPEEECTPIRTEPLDPAVKVGSLTLDEMPQGTYRAELKYGKLPPVAMTGPVTPLQQRRLSLWVGYHKVYGSLTHGGEPIAEDTTILLPGGYAFKRAEASEYEGIIRDAVGIDASITVVACDGEPRAIVLNDKVHRPGQRLDIDVPANELTITVNDTFTREPLAGTAIRMDVLTRRGASTGPWRRMQTGEVRDGESRAVVRAIPPNRQISLQVTRSGYQKQTVDAFSMTKSETKEIHVQLVPLRGTPGKITSQRPFDGATIVWFSSRGRETERADVAPDGTFACEHEHDETEVMAVVSSSHPLWIARSPRTMSFAFPDAAPVRRFDAKSALALVIDGIPMPESAVRLYQSLRRGLPIEIVWR